MMNRRYTDSNFESEKHYILFYVLKHSSKEKKTLFVNRTITCIYTFNKRKQKQYKACLQNSKL